MNEVWINTRTASFLGGEHRYSAKNLVKPVNFHCRAPKAGSVALAGDFNGWRPEETPMDRQPDGSWLAQVELSHGHHQYLFLVDGEPTLDPDAHGVVRNEWGERVSLAAVS